MLETQDRYEFRVRWQPFLLRHNIPSEGFPKPPGQSRVSAHLKEAGAAVGIDFTGKADRYPNTVKAHVLLEMAQNNLPLQNKLSEALFQAYFTDGSCLLEEDLLNIAESVGLSKSDARVAFQNQSVLNEVTEKALGYSKRGVSGVPMFYMNDQRTFSGAQEQNAFTQMFGIVADRFPFKSEEQSGAQ